MMLREQYGIHSIHIAPVPIAFLVLAFVALFSAASFGQAIAFFQFFQLFFQSHAGNYKESVAS